MLYSRRYLHFCIDSISLEHWLNRFWEREDLWKHRKWLNRVILVNHQCHQIMNANILTFIKKCLIANNFCKLIEVLFYRKSTRQTTMLSVQNRRQFVGITIRGQVRFCCVSSSFPLWIGSLRVLFAQKVDRTEKMLCVCVGEMKTMRDANIGSQTKVLRSRPTNCVRPTSFHSGG